MVHFTSEQSSDLKSLGSKTYQMNFQTRCYMTPFCEVIGKSNYDWQPSWISPIYGHIINKIMLCTGWSQMAITELIFGIIAVEKGD